MFLINDLKIRKIKTVEAFDGIYSIYDIEDKPYLRSYMFKIKEDPRVTKVGKIITLTVPKTFGHNWGKVLKWNVKLNDRVSAEDFLVEIQNTSNSKILAIRAGQIGRIVRILKPEIGAIITENTVLAEIEVDE